MKTTETEIIDPLTEAPEATSDPIDTTATPDDIDTILNSFREAPATVDPPKSETDEIPDDGAGDVYKSGKKKGQPRKRKAANFDTPEASDELTSQLLTGAMFLTLIDLLFPALIVFVNKYITGEEIDSELLKLSAAQKKELEPIADRAAKLIDWDKVNPLVLLTVCMGGLYGLNLMAAKLASKE